MPGCTREHWCWSCSFSPTDGQHRSGEVSHFHCRQERKDDLFFIRFFLFMHASMHRWNDVHLSAACLHTFCNMYIKHGDVMKRGSFDDRAKLLHIRWHFIWFTPLLLYAHLIIKLFFLLVLFIEPRAITSLELYPQCTSKLVYAPKKRLSLAASINMHAQANHSIKKNQLKQAFTSAFRRQKHIFLRSIVICGLVY